MQERTATAPDGYPVHGWVTVPARARAAPGAADDPRRPVHAVRLDTVRRDPGLRLGRLRRRAVQPPRVVRLRLGARAGDPGRRSASWTPPTCWRSWTPRWRTRRLDAGRVGVMGGSYGGYLTTVLIGRTTRFAAAISERAFTRPGQLRGVLRHRVVLPRPVPGHRSGRGWRRRAPLTGAGDHDPDAGHPLRGGLALPARAGRAALRRAQAPRRAPELLLFPGEGHELSRSGRPRHRLARFEHVLRWWARWLPTAQNPGSEPPSRSTPSLPRTTGCRAEESPSPWRCGRPGSIDPPRTGSAWQGVRSWWSAGCPAGRSCAEVVRPRRLARRRDRPALASARDHRGSAGDRPPAGAADGLRLPRRGRRGGVSLRRTRRRSTGGAPPAGAARRSGSTVDDDPGGASALPVGVRPDRLHPPDQQRGRAGGGPRAARAGVPYALRRWARRRSRRGRRRTGRTAWFQLYLWRDREPAGPLDRAEEPATTRSC